MSARGIARTEVFLDGRHVDVRVVKLTPETGDLERLTIEFPVAFKGFLSMGRADVKVVVEFDPPVAALDETQRGADV